MKKLVFLTLVLVQSVAFSYSQDKKVSLPWENGKIKVSENHRFLVHENGVPFFWLGDTGWLAASRLTRDNMNFYFSACAENGFNVVQVSVLHEIPFYNVYGKPALPNGFDFSKINIPGEYGYWDHIDYMVDAAAKKGIYIGIVCTWGANVKSGKISESDAVKYGSFLANRYKKNPNIIWLIGGDTRGDQNKEVWQTLAKTIRKIDPDHLMTYHPFGRTSSSEWFNGESWLDLNMFQSGHRRYGQTVGDGAQSAMKNAEEDNWRFVEKAYTLTPQKPILDGEPSYEGIPAGLHDFTEPLWKAEDVRRYAYWSVLAGSCGHTYGNNAIMQMLSPGINPAYGCKKNWYDAVNDPGFGQMKYLKALFINLPYTEGQPDQSILACEPGTMHDRLIANRGKDYALVYTYTGREISIDLSKISGETKNIWWYNPADGNLTFVGNFKNGVQAFNPAGGYRSGNDKVLVAVDADKKYLKKESYNLWERK